MLPRVTNFNSIKVQLEPEFGLYKSQIDDFNSIKVQLEHKIVLKTTSVLEFQFHKGTIRTKLSTELFGVLTLFQFHKGTIRTYQVFCSHHRLSDFNSIKVQLEPALFCVLEWTVLISIP